MSRVFKNKDNQITQKYKKGTHNGIDLVGYKNALDYIIAHSDGEVVGVRSNYKTTDKTGNSYGNYVKIKHGNGYYTLYAHLKYGSVAVQKADKVSKGQVIGYMGATGHCTGAHLHFEVRNKNDTKIDPTPHIDSDLPVIEEELKSLDEVAREVINGKWGNGAERKERLTEAGYNFSEVQRRVNEMLGYSSNTSNTTTTHKVVKGDTISEICVKYYGKYTKDLGNKIVNANKNKYPKITLSFIQVGWILTIPSN